jgi:hypothetical protein
MDLLDAIARLYKSAEFLKEVEEIIADNPAIDEQYKIDINRAKDICVDACSHLMTLAEKGKK